MRRTRVCVSLLGLLVLVQLNCSSTSWAWTLGAHRLIALDALTVLPPPMREALAPHVSVILAGVVEPDFNRVVSHKIHFVSLRRTPPPPRSGAGVETLRDPRPGKRYRKWILLLIRRTSGTLLPPHHHLAASPLSGG